MNVKYQKEIIKNNTQNLTCLRKMIENQGKTSNMDQLILKYFVHRPQIVCGFGH